MSPVDLEADIESAKTQQTKTCAVWRLMQYVGDLPADEQPDLGELSAVVEGDPFGTHEEGVSAAIACAVARKHWPARAFSVETLRKHRRKECRCHR